MQRSLWKGAISFGLVHIPVQMFSAEDRGHELDLTILDNRDFAPIGYKRVNKDTGREDVMTVVQRKIKAKQTTLITEPDPEEDKPAKESNIVDLMALLRARRRMSRPKRKGRVHDARKISCETPLR